MKQLFRWLSLIGIAALISGCASTQLKSTWRAPDHQGPPLKKVAVFMFSTNENMRRFAEDQVVRTLPPTTRAVAGYTLFDKPEENIANVKSRLSAENFDAVLMARTVSVDTSQVRVPEHTQIVPTAPLLVGPITTDANTLDGYYRYVWGYTYRTTPGYTANVTRILVETVLYRLPGGNPVWSAVSESRDSGSQADMVQELVQMIEKQLAKEGFIATKK